MRWWTTSSQLGEAGSMMLRQGTVSFDPLARHSVDAAGIGLLVLRAPRLGMPLAPLIRRWAARVLRPFALRTRRWAARVLRPFALRTRRWAARVLRPFALRTRRWAAPVLRRFALRTRRWAARLHDRLRPHRLATYLPARLGHPFACSGFARPSSH